MTGVANACKAACSDSPPPSSTDAFVRAIRDTSRSICGLVETAAHSAYIIGAADSESSRGHPALLDTAHFAACSQHIHDTCADLQSLLMESSSSSPQSISLDKQQLVQGATQIAHSTAALCTASQQASARTASLLAKRHFVQSAKQVANATANFVRAIKAESAAELTVSQFAALVRPLLDAVDSLCQYAGSAEFAGVLAQIGASGARAQQPILSAARTILDGGAQLIQAARALLASAKDPHGWQQFSSNSKLISEAIKRLATSVKEKAPAKSECEQALSQLECCLKHVESSLISLAMSQELTLPSSLSAAKSLTACSEHAMSCAAQITELVDQVRQAAKCEADRLGHLVTEIGQYFEPLVLNVIGCAVRTPYNIQRQTLLLEQCKTVLESMLQFLIASKENAGNPKTAENGAAGACGSGGDLHQAIDENADGTKEVCYFYKNHILH